MTSWQLNYCLSRGMKEELVHPDVAKIAVPNPKEDTGEADRFGWQDGPKTGAALVRAYLSGPVPGPMPPWRACAI